MPNANNMNNSILAAIGQPSVSTGMAGNTSTAIPANTVNLRNIATNGALLNQNISALIQKLNGLRAQWGG